jgi:hypothetical protein
MIEKTTNQMAIYQPVILNNQSNGNISTCDIKTTNQMAIYK